MKTKISLLLKIQIMLQIMKEQSNDLSLGVIFRSLLNIFHQTKKTINWVYRFTRIQNHLVLTLIVTVKIPNKILCQVMGISIFVLSIWQLLKMKISWHPNTQYSNNLRNKFKASWRSNPLYLHLILDSNIKYQLIFNRNCSNGNAQKNLSFTNTVFKRP